MRKWQIFSGCVFSNSSDLEPVSQTYPPFNKVIGTENMTKNKTQVQQLQHGLFPLLQMADIKTLQCAGHRTRCIVGHVVYGHRI